MALGATIDFEAGNLKRAPKWMSEVGLEWLFRIVCEPKRLWKRYLVDDLPFLILILKQKLNLYITKEHKNSNPIWQIADRF
jgi:UDP-N-acetyl-D-mannosaminuronic acid transferase (WecB/TagA/CpsF family)